MWTFFNTLIFSTHREIQKKITTICVYFISIFFILTFSLSAQSSDQESIPATLKWRVLSSVYPYSNSGYVFLSSGQAIADACAKAIVHPGNNMNTWVYTTSITACPSSSLSESFIYDAEHYSSPYIETYVFKADNRTEDYKRGFGLDRHAFCESEEFPVLDTRIENGKYSRAECLREFVLVLPQESQPPENCAGNPIEISSGAKIQTETDIKAKGEGQVSFERTYNNSNKKAYQMWSHTYQQKIDILDPQKINLIREKGLALTSKSAACITGWSVLKGKISDHWAWSTGAEYNNGVCEIKGGGRIVRTLPIITKRGEMTSTIMTVQLTRQNGSNYTYQEASSAWVPLGPSAGTLEKVNAGIVQWRLTTHSGDREEYSAKGQLLSITADNGMKQQLTYDLTTGLLATVRDDAGRQLQFNYNAGQLNSITVDGNKTTRYRYNAAGLFTDVQHPDNTYRRYHYEDTRFPNALTGITDERNVRYATWAYDAQGRGISSEHAGGAEKTLLAFNEDRSTTVTNALGKKTIYHFLDVGGIKRVSKVEGVATTHCVGANQNYTYTPEGHLKSKTDWKGYRTVYSYNSRGQEISRTEAYGTAQARTITTDWHPGLFVKTKITEPDKETFYQYDATGRLLSQTIRSLTY